VMVGLLLRGNSYAHIAARDGRFRPIQLELLDPDAVQPRMVDGEIQYWVKGEQIPTQDVWHIRGMTLPGCKVGLSPIAYGAAQMGIELSALRFAKDFFDGGGIPKAVLESDMEINQEQARTLKERLVAATRNREPIALGQGVKYVPIQVKPDESQFIATQQNAVASIARFFFMPPEMVGGSSGSSMTYANREQRAIDYATYTVSPWLKRLEDAYFPMLPAPWYVSFDESNLLRMDAETQAKVRVIYIAGKVMPPSRTLKSMNEPPLTDAEKTELELVPMTVTPMGMPKALPNPPTPATSADTPNVGKNQPTEG
jgi:HK97 family phage portal protein